MPKQRITQYCVPMKNEPGSLFRVTQTLARDGVNISGIMSENLGEVSFVRFISDKESSAVRRPLETAGYEVFENQVFQGELHILGKFMELNRLEAVPAAAGQRVWGPPPNFP